MACFSCLQNYRDIRSLNGEVLTKFWRSFEQLLNKFFMEQWPSGPVHKTNGWLQGRLSFILPGSIE